MEEDFYAAIGSSVKSMPKNNFNSFVDEEAFNCNADTLRNDLTQTRDNSWTYFLFSHVSPATASSQDQNE